MIQKLKTLDAALPSLEAAAGLTLFLGDWDEGFKVERDLDGARAAGMIRAARDKYGDRFTWRAFNETFEAFWDQDSGVLCMDPPLETKRFFLETDAGPNPGVRQFRPDGPSASDFTRIEVEEIREGNHVIHLRMVKMLREEKDGR